MQIRIRKNTLTLLRTVYDPAIKRGRSVSLGSVPIASRELPAEIAAKLTPSEREQVLQRGSRLDEEVAGHGLGLAIVRDIVDSWGARLTLTQSPLGGLCVRIELPRKVA